MKKIILYDPYKNFGDPLFDDIEVCKTCKKKLNTILFPLSQSNNIKLALFKGFCSIKCQRKRKRS